MARYKNIPVLPQVHTDLQAIAEANGRAMSEQIRFWVERELPDCEHEKQSVIVQYFPGNDVLTGGEALQRLGWYCPTCKRVYERRTTIGEATDIIVASNLAVKDPYVHITPTPPTKKRRTQRVVTEN